MLRVWILRIYIYCRLSSEDHDKICVIVHSLDAIMGTARLMTEMKAGTIVVVCPAPPGGVLHASRDVRLIFK